MRAVPISRSVKCMHSQQVTLAVDQTRFEAPFEQSSRKSFISIINPVIFMIWSTAQEVWRVRFYSRE